MARETCPNHLMTRLTLNFSKSTFPGQRRPSHPTLRPTGALAFNAALSRKDLQRLVAEMID